MSKASDIRDAIKSAITTELSDWAIMHFPRFPEKNSSSSIRVFNVMVGGADSLQGAGSGALIKKLTLDQDFTVILGTRFAQTSLNEGEVETAEDTLLNAAESVVDIGYLANFSASDIINVNSLNYSEFEFLDDNDLAILRLTFNIKYRYTPANS